MENPVKQFLKPEDFLKIQLKKRQLQKRLQQQNSKSTNEQDKPTNSFTNVFERQKRPNPFAKDCDHEQKKLRGNNDDTTEGGDTIFELIHNTISKPTPNLEEPLAALFAKHEDEIMGRCIDSDDESEEEEEEIEPITKLPIDWSIKSRIRVLSKTMVAPSMLTSSVEASGQTGFVRCLDIRSTSSGLDISDAARFHQNTMYWQYPHFPWLNLVNRNAGTNNPFKMEQKETDILFKDWTESFRNLFQLLRSRQCPYFYVLANQYNVLFRAAGIGGRVEMHALLTPTTKGFRQMLKDEEIEFTQPLKNKSGKTSITPNTSNSDNLEAAVEDEEEEDEMTFLENLGVKKGDIKFKEDVKAKQKEFEDDHGDVSTALIEGFDCQAFFDFLLNAKSTIPKVGRLAGIPPTLLAPVAFLGSTLRRQTQRCTKLKADGEELFSIELMGAILPHTIHTMTAFLSEIKDSYTITMSNYVNTIAFTKTSKKLMEDLDSSQAVADHVFGRENLSDCGMSNEILESMCRVDADAVNILERLQYNKEIGGYIYDS